MSSHGSPKTTWLGAVEPWASAATPQAEIHGSHMAGPPRPPSADPGPGDPDKGALGSLAPYCPQFSRLPAPGPKEISRGISQWALEKHPVHRACCSLERGTEGPAILGVRVPEDSSCLDRTSFRLRGRTGRERLELLCLAGVAPCPSLTLKRLLGPKRWRSVVLWQLSLNSEASTAFPSKPRKSI